MATTHGRGSAPRTNTHTLSCYIPEAYIVPAVSGDPVYITHTHHSCHMEPLALSVFHVGCEFVCVTYIKRMPRLTKICPQCCVTLLNH